MIDISDGFILDLFRVLEESHKGAILYKEKIPVTTGESDFSRGEDYELIFTIDKGERKLQALKRRFHLVGMIKDKAYGYKMQSGSKVYRIKPCGYLHF
jgi:thiamine monophosphate kinase